MQALYRLYRPQKFSELIGQEHVSKTLLKALETGKVSHAYLFIGPRGTGKTSTARILAKAVNCLRYKTGILGEPCNECESCQAVSEGRYLDLLEIDAASNRGIDEIRDLREKIKLAPTGGKYKIYIIDEVHMLTNEAFNALLKTLEEPPAHAIFVLCTTDPQKIPTTIRSRCQVYEFKTPSVAEIIQVLKNTAKEEKSEVTEVVLEKLAKKARGAYRDALVLLEKHILSGEVEEEIEIAQLAISYAQGDSKQALQILNKSINRGINPKAVAEALLDWNRKALLLKVGLEKDPSFEMGSDKEELLQYSSKIDLSTIKKILVDLTTSMEEFRYSSIPQLPLEIAIVSNDTSLKKSAFEPKPAPDPLEKIKVEGDKEEKNPEIELTAPPTNEDHEVIKVKSGNTEVTISTTSTPEIVKDEFIPVDEKYSDLQLIQEKWLELLRKLRPVNHSLEALLRSSEPTNYQNGELTLKFFYKFHKERVEDPKYRAQVEKIFGDETGLPINLKLVLSDTPRPVTTRVASQTETPNVKIVEDKDIPEAALDIFTN